MYALPVSICLGGERSDCFIFVHFFVNGLDPSCRISSNVCAFDASSVFACISKKNYQICGNGIS